MKSAFFARNLSRCIPLFAPAMLASLFFATAQTKEAGGELQQKVAAVKQSVAKNQQKLHQYQWTEKTQITLKGDAKPPSQSLCQYGPNGQLQETPIGTVAPSPSGGRIKQKIVEKKKEEMQDYMGQVKTVLAKYVPPDPQKMEQTLQAGNASLNPNPGAQTVALIILELRPARGADDTLFWHSDKKSHSMERTMCSRRFLTRLPKSCR